MDQDNPLLKILFIRHGQSTYKDTMPDLTPEGLRQIEEETAPNVLNWMNRHRIIEEELILTSSPAARARGTAQALKRAVQMIRKVYISHAIAPMAFRDPERCTVALKGLKGRGYIDYETESVFRDSTLFETPEEIRIRCYEEISRLVKKARSRVIYSQRMIFSHYEVLCPITQDLFHITPSATTALRNGEHIELVVSECDENHVLVKGLFRGTQEESKFSLDKLSFS